MKILIQWFDNEEKEAIIDLPGVPRVGDLLPLMFDGDPQVFYLVEEVRWPFEMTVESCTYPPELWLRNVTSKVQLGLLPSG